MSAGEYGALDDDGVECPLGCGAVGDAELVAGHRCPNAGPPAERDPEAWCGANCPEDDHLPDCPWVHLYGSCPLGCGAWGPLSYIDEHACPNAEVDVRGHKAFVSGRGESVRLEVVNDERRVVRVTLDMGPDEAREVAGQLLEAADAAENLR